MNRPASIWLTAAALAMSLGACTTGSNSGPVATRGQMAAACPTPTAQGRLAAIAAYLGAAPAGAGLDALATEWERLDEAARACRRR